MKGMPVTELFQVLGVRKRTTYGIRSRVDNNSFGSARHLHIAYAKNLCTGPSILLCEWNQPGTRLCRVAQWEWHSQIFCSFGRRERPYHIVLQFGWSARNSDVTYKMYVSSATLLASRPQVYSIRAKGYNTNYHCPIKTRHKKWKVYKISINNKGEVGGRRKMTMRALKR